MRGSRSRVGGGRERRRDERHPSSSSSFLYNALHIVEVHTTTGAFARAAAFTKYPSRASLLLSCLAFMFSSTSFATGTYLVSGAPALRGGIHLSARRRTIQLQLFQRRTRSGRARRARRTRSSAS